MSRKVLHTTKEDSLAVLDSETGWSTEFHFFKLNVTIRY